MENSLRNFARFEDKLWFIDFDSDPMEVEIVLPDGSSRPATKADGDLFEVLELGVIVPEPDNFIHPSNK